MQNEVEYLRILAIFHYVVGAIAAVFSFLPVIHLAIGVMIMTGQFDVHEPPLRWAGGLMTAIAALIIVIGLVFAILVIVAGTKLRRRRNYTFCLVMAGIECMFMPFGTVLGIFTILLLTRPGVREMFEPPPEASPA